MNHMTTSDGPTTTTPLPQQQLFAVATCHLFKLWLLYHCSDHCYHHSYNCYYYHSLYQH